MNGVTLRSALHQFPLTATLTILSGLSVLNNTALADEQQTSRNSSLQKSVPVKTADGLKKSPSSKDPRGKSSLEKPTQQGSRPTRDARQKVTIQHFSAYTSASTDGKAEDNSAGKAESVVTLSAAPLPVPETAKAPAKAPADTSTVAPVQTPVLSATARVKQALEESRRLQTAAAMPDARSVSEVTEPQFPATTGSTSSPPSLTREMIEGAENGDALEQAKTARFLMLKLQLQHLKSRLQASGNGLRQSPQQPSSNTVDNSEPSPVTSPTQPSDDTASDHAATNHGSSADNHPAAAEPAETNPVHPAEDDSLPTILPPVDSSHHDASASKIVATHDSHPAAPQSAVVDGPIDRLGLANNLYAVGEFLLALEMYEKADTTEMTAQQQIWTEYQIANCLRRIGRKTDAANRYRRLAAQPEAGWLSGQSHWWFEVLEQTRQLEIAMTDDGTSTSARTGPSTAGRPSTAGHSTAGPSDSRHSAQARQNSKESKHGQSPP